MKLLNQFEIIAFSYFFGILFMFLYSFLNRIFYKDKGTLFRLLIEIIFFSSLSFIYFVGSFLISHAIFNVFPFLFIILGIITYQELLAYYFNLQIETIICKLDYQFKKKIAIIKKKGKKYGKSKRKEKKKE